MDFIEIRGASGKAYRFRAWPGAGVHPPIAGNYALIEKGSSTVIAIGVLDDLSQAPNELANLAREASLFTRFNVARAAREAEHEDMAQHILK